MKYLIRTTEEYRVATVEEVEKLHEALSNDSHFTLASFGYKTKYLKQRELRVSFFVKDCWATARRWGEDGKLLFVRMARMLYLSSRNSPIRK